MLTKNHYYTNLMKNPWPYSITAWSMNSFLSLNLLMKFMDYFFLFNLIILMLNSFQWWINYSIEYKMEGGGLINVENMVKICMILFILSEIMVFISMFWSFFQFYLSPDINMGLKWPPKLIKMFTWYNIPLMNTMILIMSSITLTISHYKMNKNELNQMKLFLMFTILLGLTFSMMQVKEYNNSFFSLNDSCYGSCFFMITGLHGIHVLIGSAFLSYNLTMVSKNINSNMMFNSLELSSWYWHFVDLIWLFVFYTIYYII